MASSPNQPKEIFLRAIELTSSEQRADFLAEACWGDESLRRQIEAMLEAHGANNSFLEKPAAAMGATVDADGAIPNAPVLPDDNIGKRIGPYKLLEQIGAGGMGVVFMAEQQEPVRRFVALKIIKPGMDSGQILARFEAERQALALMDHPNIAKVFDAGATDDGRPFFVMELVKGTPITRFCDERRLPTRERLEQFILVCQAIQHAHQKGIIHRDIKPSNVLIALYDDKPVPKVIDFGVAKAAGQPLTEKTLNTGFGTIVGTPEYMSPEQATFNQLDIDTRSDVYALGVLLYELLTGTTPVDKTRLKEAALLEVLRIVREDEPPRPSLKLSTSKASATIAQTRGIEAAELSRLLRGELDWIVMKSLEKDRNRRYDTAASLARDVERYLKDELVEARPPSVGYRLRKALRKHRGPVIAASLVLLTLVVGGIGTTVGMMRAMEEERKALAALEQADQQRWEAVEQRGLALAAKVEASEAAQDATRALRRAEENERKAKASEKNAKLQALRADTARHAIQMEAVFRAWERDDMVSATRILDEAPEAFRKTWEYRYLRNLCNRQALPMQSDGDARPDVRGWALSHDGKSIAAIFSHDEKLPPRIKIWKAATGDMTSSIALAAPLLNKLPFGFAMRGGSIIHSNPLLVFSPDGKRVVWAAIDKSEKHRLEVLDLESGRSHFLVRLDDHFSSSSPSVSRDGKWLGIALIRHQGVKVLDMESGKEKLHIPAGETPHLVAFSEDGKRVAVGDSLLGLCIYAVENGKKELTLTSDKKSGTHVRRASFSPDGKLIMAYLAGTGPHYDSVKVWDAETGKEKFSRIPLTPGLGTTYDVGFADAGKSVVIVNTIPSLKAQVFDVETGQEKPITAPLGRTTCRFLDAAGERVPVKEDRYLFLRSLAKPSLQSATLQQLDYAAHQGFTSNNRVYALDEHQAFGTWDATTGKREHALKFVRDVYFSTTFTADGKRVACPDLKEKVVRIFDTVTGKELVAIPCGDFVQFAVPSPDGQRLISIESQKAKLWDVEAKREILELWAKGGAGNTVRTHVFSPDSRMLAAAAQDGAIDLWDARTGKKISTINTHDKEYIKQVLFFLDGKRLLTHHRNDSRTDFVKIWDIQSGAPQGTIRVESRTFDDPKVVLGPDGKRLALGNDLYDVALGQRVFAFPSDVVIRAINPDGRRIVATYNEQKNRRYGVCDAP